MASVRAEGRGAITLSNKKCRGESIFRFLGFLAISRLSYVLGAFEPRPPPKFPLG